MSRAVITNALLRCTREDRFAQEVFELVRADLGLWVFELPEDFREIVAALSAIRPLLRRLSEGSSDYTLHLAATIDQIHSLRIPADLTELSGECGFAIEVSADQL